jgi:hypothetical protein
MSGNSVVNISGITESSAVVSAVSATNGEVRFSGVCNNTNGIAAIYAPKVYMTGSTSWRYQESNLNESIYLYTADELSGFPPEAKTEEKYVFGPSGEFTGELSPVVVNTAQLATDLFDAIIASSDPLAVRLKNTATVSTVNDAIGSLNVIP